LAAAESVVSSTPLSLADLRALGVTLTTAEALAVAQSLFESRADDACPPFGPLSAGNILLSIDGSVTSTACAATPTVLEAAILLEELLPDGHPQVPGALRYTLARALHEVAAPPFDSLADFSSALRRFEQGERAAMVRGVHARAAAPPAVVESVWETVALPFAAAVLAGVALIGAGRTMHVSRTPPPVHAAVITSLDAQPIVFNPPPMIATIPAVSLVRAAVAPIAAPDRRQPSARRDNPPAHHANFFSRMFSRIRIRVDKL
jgi:hypothetical protein